MKISGKNFIGDKLSGLGRVTYKTIDPLKNIVNEIINAEILKATDAIIEIINNLKLYKNIVSFNKRFLYYLLNICI